MLGNGNLTKGLQILVDNGDFDKALSFCHSAIAQGLDHQFWFTQLGYVSFLDERHFDSYYSAPRIFADLCANYPNDMNACFWHGYSLIIIVNKTLEGLEQLRAVIASAPGHAYGHIAVAGSTASVSERVEMLEQALEIQPTNYRALEDLSTALAASGDLQGAIAMLERILKTPPFVETAYGIMNAYINGPLTLASQKKHVRSRVQDRIAALRDALSSGNQSRS